MRKLRMGMVGGGPGSFIGAIHRKAAALDGYIDLVCGAFSSDPEKSKLINNEPGQEKVRIYDSYHQMLEEEVKLDDGIRMDFVSIVTPNHLHYEPAFLALKNKFYVICDKPLTTSYQDAVSLSKIAQQSGLLFGITYTYTGYPMVKEARELIRKGTLGKIRKVLVDYSQGWLSTSLESTGHKQASWRTDPEKAGAGSLGDIGTHAFNLAEYVSGLKIEAINADLTTLVENRRVDDDCNMLLRFENGAKGVLSASQVCTGEENALILRVYGEKAGLEWHQMDPNTLVLKYPDQPQKKIRPGTQGLSEITEKHIRLPAGHPEGFIEAFANIYRNFALRLLDDQSDVELYDFPGIDEGVRGMQFIETSINSSKSQSWKLI